MSKTEVTIKIIDREGVSHEVQAPTDMNMNIMELVRAYELAPEGTIGICGGIRASAFAETRARATVPVFTWASAGATCSSIT